MRFLACALPESPGLEGLEMEARELGAVRVEFPRLDPGATAELVRRVAGRGPSLRERSSHDIAAALGCVGRRFGDPADPLRTEALELLPDTAGISGAMATAVLDGMARDWTEDALTGLLAAELEDPACLDGFATVRGRRLMAVGPELCVQIVAGSVAGVGVQALLRSLLVKSPTVLKPGLGDVVLPVLFAAGLREEDPGLAEALAVVYWPGGSAEVEDAALRASDAVVVYGSDGTVRAVRDRTPVHARFIGYRHRSGVGVVGRDALQPGASGEAARDVARAVALFDQRGCVSPHVVYVERATGDELGLFADCVAEALVVLEGELPSGPMEVEQASALQQVRGTAELLEASGAVSVRHAGGRASWTVVAGPGAGRLGAPGGRTVALVPFDSLEELGPRLREEGPALQSVGFAGFEGRAEELARVCGDAGASRLAPFRSMPFPPPWWLHDGRGPLRELLRWVELAEADDPGPRGSGGP